MGINVKYTIYWYKYIMKERWDKVDKYSIIIYDNNNKIIGELMTATPTDIIKFINKGFRVVNKITGNDITIDELKQNIGVSDGVIDVG